MLAPYVETPTGPVGLTTTEDGAVWVVGAQSETVLRIPAGATEPDLTVDVPGVPLRTTAAYGSVWVTSFDGKELLRLDPATGEVVATIKTGAGPEGVAAGFDSIWVVAQDAGKLLRIDPGTNAVSDEIKLEVGARLVEAGPDAMYVAHYADDMILRVDPKTNAVTSSEAVCDGPQAMAVLDGKVWVTCTLSDELVALDATTLQKVASVPVEGSPDSVLATDGRAARRGRRGRARPGLRRPRHRDRHERARCSARRTPSTTGPTSTSRWPAARRGSARSTRTGCTTCRCRAEALQGSPGTRVTLTISGVATAQIVRDCLRSPGRGGLVQPAGAKVTTPSASSDRVAWPRATSSSRWALVSIAAMPLLKTSSSSYACSWRVQPRWPATSAELRGPAARAATQRSSRFSWKTSSSSTRACEDGATGPWAGRIRRSGRARTLVSEAMKSPSGCGVGGTVKPMDGVIVGSTWSPAKSSPSDWSAKT